MTFTKNKNQRLYYNFHHPLIHHSPLDLTDLAPNSRAPCDAEAYAFLCKNVSL